MADSSSETTVSTSAGLRSLFSGYFPPTEEQLRVFVCEGLVVLDTNALLDVYRFTEKARGEYLAALGLLGDRLWIPHRVGEEFFDNREGVIEGWDTERAEVRAQLLKAMIKPAASIAWYGRRRGATRDQVGDLTQRLENTIDAILAELDGVRASDTAPQPDPHSDPVLARIDALIGDRVGGPFDIKAMAGLQRMWSTRKAAKVPPGYADEDKGDREIGDFLVWEQTMREADARKMPVLLICNENKPDWTRSDGTTMRPRPELVQEMAKRAGQAFHLVDVHTFLTLAREHLAAAVSATTVAEATLLASAVVSPALPQSLAEAFTVTASPQFETDFGARIAREVFESAHGKAALSKIYESFGSAAAMDPETTGALRSIALSAFDTSQFFRSVSEAARLSLLAGMNPATEISPAHSGDGDDDAVDG